MKKVYGSYSNTGKARRAIDQLFEQGFTSSEIKVVSNTDLGGELNYTQGDVEKDDKGLWDKIKDAFTSDDYDENYWERDLDNDERTALQGYKSNLQSGEIVILVDDQASSYTTQFEQTVPGWNPGENEDLGLDRDIDLDRNLDLDRDNLNDEEVIELKKEKLNIDKEEVKVGEVDVKKVVKEETQTVEVPLEKEEVIIERRSVGDREVRDGEGISSDSFKDGEEIHIPIKEEQVNVNKKTVVDDEVVIRKDKYQENKTITEEVKHEDIEVEGDAEVREDFKDDNKRKI